MSKRPILMDTDRLFLIAGPCVIEDRDLALRVGSQLAEMAVRLGITVIYKSSFDKANRTAITSARGPGLEEGLEILAIVKRETELPILTDVHECWQVAPVAEVADVLQVPAFLSRQTDLLLTAAGSGRVVNVKKGQFMAPTDMIQVARKIETALPAGHKLSDSMILCERGTSFGYQDLVVDMRSLGILRATGLPIVFDATHSVQRPGMLGTMSSGSREFTPLLARAAVAAGVDGVFFETHPNPASARSDSATVWPLDRLEGLMADLLAIHDLVGKRRMLSTDACIAASEAGKTSPMTASDARAA